MLNRWCDHISYLINKRQSNYTGTAIKGFRDGKRTKHTYEAMVKYCIDHARDADENFSIDTSNMGNVLLYFFDKSDPTDYAQTTLNLLEKIIKNKSIFQMQITNETLEILEARQKSAKESFDNIQFENPFSHSINTTIINSTLNGLQLNDTSIINDPPPIANTINSNDTLSIQSLVNSFNQLNIQISSLTEKVNGLNNDYNYDKKTFVELKQLLAFRLRKKLMLENSKTINQKHLDNKGKTAPKQLQARNFFTPFSYSTSFLEEMDKILIESQNKVLTLIIKENNTKIAKIDDDILFIKKSLNKFKSKKEIDDLQTEITNIEEIKLKKKFQKSLDKIDKTNSNPSFATIYHKKINDNLLDNISIKSNNSNSSFVSTVSKKSNKSNFSNKSYNSNKNVSFTNNVNRPKSILKNRSRSPSASNVNRQKNQNNKFHSFNQQKKTSNNNQYNNRYNNTYNNRTYGKSNSFYDNNDFNQNYNNYNNKNNHNRNNNNNENNNQNPNARVNFHQASRNTFRR